ncbi:MAG: N-acetyltransferase [Gracilibacteraceae bacterium]|jgi:amino-acid N-acetyltransferase|nr:N-acetyltransferase [Gracilibacteraceae bacterium]
MIEYRKSRLTDVEDMLGLVRIFADQGLMLPRSRHSLYEGIREYQVAHDSDRLVGIGALRFLWHDLAEIRTLATASDYQKQGVGREIVRLLLAEADEMDCRSVFTLTYQVGFFEKMGFQRVEKDSLPQKVWQECINCIKFPNCDETALVRRAQEG